MDHNTGAIHTSDNEDDNEGNVYISHKLYPTLKPTYCYKLEISNSRTIQIWTTRNGKSKDKT